MDESPQAVRIAIIGAWHQASVLAACLAAMGHDVCCVGDDAAAIRELACARAPVFEPGLDALLAAHVNRNLRFTASYEDAVADRDFIFLSHDTPLDDADRPQLEPIWHSARELGGVLREESILCVTSQVPVGTCERICETVREAGGRLGGVAYIPEFLRLGAAIESFRHADRVVIGCDDRAVADRIASLYRPLGRPLLQVSLRSAEMAKHACNAFLATSISFANEIADLCEQVGADVVEVAGAMRLDRRIGPHAFLSAGLGFAGGTLGRDVRSLQSLGEQVRRRTRMMDAVMEINGTRVHFVSTCLHGHLGTLQGKRIGILGLTYKAGTDTLRRSLALEIIDRLTQDGALVRAFDPLAKMDSASSLPSFERCDTAYAAAERADALVLITESPEISSLDWTRLRKIMRNPLFIDTRNLYEPHMVEGTGFTYVAPGRGRRSRPWSNSG